MNYCSHCGHSELEHKIPPGDSRERITCPNCGTIHYQNPKMVVGCLPVYENKILLCRRAIEPRSGFWNLPAGYLENGETLEGGAIRETWEEAKARVIIERMHCVYNIPRINQVYFFFLASLEGPDFAVGAESAEVRLFTAKEIPYTEMAFPSSSFAIQRYFDHLDAPFAGVHIGHAPA